MTLLDEIRKDSQFCFKYVYIKRRLNIPVAGSYYETDWFDITDYLLDVSEATVNIDDVTLNEFTQGDFTVKLNNVNGKFNSENYPDSFFNGYLTRHKTLVLIKAGYIDTELGVVYSYDSALGIVNGDEVTQESDGTINLSCLAPTMVLEEADASTINLGIFSGGTATATTAFRLIDASAVFTRGQVGLEVTNTTTNNRATVLAFNSTTDLLLDSDIFAVGATYTFGQTKWYESVPVSTMVNLIYGLQRAGNAVLQPFLTGLDNTPAIDTIANVYDFSGMNCRDALTKLAEISNSCFYVTPAGRLQFTTKTPPGASVITFSNMGSDVNILSADDFHDGVKNKYTKVTFSGTNPEISSDESAWGIGDSSFTWKYGQKSYDVENPFITLTADKLALCNQILGMTLIPKEEITLVVKFMPQLHLLDPVTLNYYGLPTKSNPTFWGKSYWNKGLWVGSLGGIRITNASMKIMRLSHNFMDFTTTVVLRRI